MADALFVKHSPPPPTFRVIKFQETLKIIRAEYADMCVLLIGKKKGGGGAKVEAIRFSHLPFCIDSPSPVFDIGADSDTVNFPKAH